MGGKSKSKNRTLKKRKQIVKPDQLAKKRKVIGGFTIKDRKTELMRQKEILDQKGWVFQSVDKRYLIATFLGPKQPWSRKKKIIVWAIITWFGLGIILMFMEEKQDMKPIIVIEEMENKE